MKQLKILNLLPIINLIYLTSAIRIKILSVLNHRHLNNEVQCSKEDNQTLSAKLTSQISSIV